MNRKAVSIVVAGALAAPMAVHALDASVSGHIARVVQHVSGPGSPSKDDPPGASFQHKDAGVSGSRFRITGSEDLGNGLTAGVNLEYAAGGDSASRRHTALSLSGDFGSVAMGHTGPVTNTSNDDLSASGLAVDMACSDAVGASCSDFTTGRQGIVRYTTPGSLGPVGAGVSLGSGLWDAQLTASGDMMGGGSYAVRAGYADFSRKHSSAQAAAVAAARTAVRDAEVREFFGDDLTPEQEVRARQIRAGFSDAEVEADSRYSVGRATGRSVISIAGAVKYQGVSLSALWGKNNPDGAAQDAKGFGLKVGYDWGNSGVGVLYRSMNPDSGSADPKTWGFGFQHNMKSVEFFTGYYIANPDDGTEKTKTFNLGTRVKFN